MNDQPIRDQAKAIREQHDARPTVPQESPREARYRVEREKAQAEAKKHPHRRY